MKGRTEKNARIKQKVTTDVIYRYVVSFVGDGCGRASGGIAWNLGTEARHERASFVHRKRGDKNSQLRSCLRAP